MKRIIGIDPGLSKTGWAIIEYSGSNISYIASGIIKLSPDKMIAEKLGIIHEKLTQIIAEYKPIIASFEDSFVNSNSASSLKLGQARGAILLTLHLCDIEIYEYSPTYIKKAITGNGRADKGQVAKMVQYLLPKANFKSADESDAIAIAIAHRP